MRHPDWAGINGPTDPRAVNVVTEGTVVELLPSQLARIDLDGRHQVIAHLGEPVHRNYIRVLVGDRVRVALTAVDRTRGRIVGKL